MSGRRAYPALALCGLAASFAFPEPGLAPLAWVAPVPLLVALRDASVRRAAALGAAFGAAFFGSLLIWVSIVGYVAWAVLVVVETSFVAGFAAVAARAARGRGEVAAGAVTVAAWVAFELARSLVPVGGFTWGQLAQSQTATPLLRLASLGGGWLVSGACIAIAAALAAAWRRRAVLPALAAVAIAVVPAAIPAPVPDGRSLTVAIVQGNVPESFTGTFYEKERAIVASHARLTRALAGRGVDLVVWPESSVGIDIRRDAEVAQQVRSAIAAAGTDAIVGGNLDIDAERYRVVAFALGDDGEVRDVYRKTHLVPFGEYVPARDLLDWIPMLDQVPRDVVAGDEGKIFQIGGVPVAVVISYEGDFGSLVRGRIADGGRLLVVATNTSTWERSWASAQHLAFSRLRAAENGVWVVHAALSGTSGFVHPSGEVYERTALWEATTAVHDVAVARTVTPYARFGDWFPWLCVAVVLAALASGPWLTSRRTTRDKPSS